MLAYKRKDLIRLPQQTKDLLNKASKTFDAMSPVCYMVPPNVKDLDECFNCEKPLYHETYYITTFWERPCIPILGPNMLAIKAHVCQRCIENNQWKVIE